MQRQVVPDSFKEEQKLFLNQLMDGLLGDIIILEADTTTAADLLKSGDVGFNPATARLFLNIDGVVYTLLMTAV